MAGSSNGGSQENSLTVEAPTVEPPTTEALAVATTTAGTRVGAEAEAATPTEAVSTTNQTSAAATPTNATTTEAGAADMVTGAAASSPVTAGSTPPAEAVVVAALDEVERGTAREDTTAITVPKAATSSATQGQLSTTGVPGMTAAAVPEMAAAAVPEATAPTAPDTATATTPTTGQLTDREIRLHQLKDKQIAKLLRAGYRGQWEILEDGGLVCARARNGQQRVVLPVALQHKELREAHDSIFAWHLRIPQTLARISAVYWWPGMQTSVRTWVRSCRDCGTRKARPKEVVPPLRALGLGEVGDRWALDVAGPLPITARGNRYVVAAVEYATRYAVAIAVPTHTAKDVARFIMERIVLVHGPLREIVMDGAPELNGKVIEELVALLQAKQTTPVPYRPALLGLVERFHRSWKDMVSIYVSADQRDWDDWIACALYAYNGAQYSTTGYSPNELMLGRRLRAPNELLRASGLTQIGSWADYHRSLVAHMDSARMLARQAAARDQARRERYYNQRVRRNAHFRVGDLVWVLRPPRGKGTTKLVHRWMGRQGSRTTRASITGV